MNTGNDIAGAKNSDQLEPIAIVGMGCRFPGGVSRPDELWKLLVDEVDALEDIPADRFSLQRYYHARQGKRGKIAHRQGGFLGPLRGFDASFFGISPREATVVDPQQRLLMETTWEALEDALIPPAKVAGSRTAVYIGMWSNEYEDRLHRSTDDYDVYTTTGTGRYAASGRLSFIFDFQGPSFVVDTACSSALVGVHLAAASLRSGESEMAVAGGTNLLLSPEISIGYSRSKMLSKGENNGDGRCKFGDASVGGYVRSEGVGVVILKTLSRAQADGDLIYALVRGSAVNNDGRNSGLLVQPAQKGQEYMLEQAYENAGVDPASVQYVECHGTGTRAGDPVETQALGNVLGKGRPENQPFFAGSIKTNIGHCEAASGVAGMMKAILALKNNKIPASLHFNNPNPKIPWDELPLRIPTKLTDWPSHDGPARAGVNSFGVTATNAHVVLEEAPAPAESHPALPADRPYCLVLSTRGEEALEAMARNYISYIKEADSPALADICWSAAVGRGALDNRLSCTARTKEEMVEQLQAFVDGEERLGMYQGITNAGEEHELVFVASGQGPKFWPLDQELLEKEPVFRATLEKCDAELKKLAGWSLLEEITKADNPLMERTEYTQPALCSYQIAIFEMWRARGIRGTVIGHSMGEVSAAYMSGALSLEDAMLVIYHRGRLIQTLCGKGKMAFVDLPPEKTLEYLKGYEDKLSVAAYNSPGNTVISGETAALTEVTEAMTKDEVFCKILESVDFASHSPQMSAIQQDLREALKDIKPRAGNFPFMSTVTAKIEPGESLDANYWAENIRQPVKFSQGILALAEEGRDVFLEIAPHPALSQSVKQCLKAADIPGAVIPSLLRDKDKLLVAAAGIGGLFCAGYELEFDKAFPGPGRKVKLPLYPWQRDEYWIREEQPEEENLLASSVRLTRTGEKAHPFLSQYIHSANQSYTHTFETRIDAKSFPYLEDHKVRNLVVFPGAAFSELALAGAREAFPGRDPYLMDVEISRALTLPEKGRVDLQLAIVGPSLGHVRFEIYSREMGRDNWERNSSGKIKLEPREGEQSTRREPVVDLDSSDVLTISQGEHYEAMKLRDLNYGPFFQGIKEIRRRDDEAVAHLGFAEAIRNDSANYGVHPSVLDQCFQLLVGLVSKSSDAGASETYLPVGFRSLRIHKTIGSRDEMRVHGSIRPFSQKNDEPGTRTGDLYLMDSAGDVLLHVDGLRLRKLTREVARADESMFYEVAWRESAQPAAGSASGRWLIFADANGLGDDLATRLRKNGAACALVRASDGPFRAAGKDEYYIKSGRRADYEKLIAVAAKDGPLTGIVHMWSLDAPRAGELEEAPTRGLSETIQAVNIHGSLSVAYLARFSARASGPAPRFYLISGGTQPAGSDIPPSEPLQGTLAGLSRVLAYEMKDNRVTHIDISSPDARDDLDALVNELTADATEREVALRGTRRYTRRLAQADLDTVEHPSVEADPGKDVFGLEVLPGAGSDSIVLKMGARRYANAPVASHLVEIRVAAAGISRADVLTASGAEGEDLFGSLAPTGLGRACKGVITRVGTEAALKYGFKEGDEVAAITRGAVASFVLADARQVRYWNPVLADSVIAVLDDYMTAYLAYGTGGRLSADQTVLITRADSGVGRAALYLARVRGARVFATCRDAKEMENVREQGALHVFADDEDYVDEVLKITGSRGVDIVLNSPGDETGAYAFSALGSHGRFLEIGTNNNYKNKGMRSNPRARNVTVSAVDIDHLVQNRPGETGTVMAEILAAMSAGSLPVPRNHDAHFLTQYARAIKHAESVKWVNPVLLKGETEIVGGIQPALLGNKVFKKDGAYLITGGLGDLGLLLAEWLAPRGAGKIILAGRSAPSRIVQARIKRILKQYPDLEIETRMADVSDAKHAEDLVEFGAKTIPLRGIFHTAGVLEDGMLAGIDRRKFLKAMAPKVQGAWNLHWAVQKLESTKGNIDLDYFVLYSSVASLLGTMGQGNYAAGNSFMDALAYYRRARGLPALSIQWGPWGEIGLAAEDKIRGNRLEGRGLPGIKTEEGIAAVERLLSARSVPTQVAVMHFDWAAWSASYDVARQFPFFHEIAEDADVAAPSLETTSVEQAKPAEAAPAPAKAKAEEPLEFEDDGANGGFSAAALSRKSVDDRKRFLVKFVSEVMADVLRTSPSKLNPSKPLSQLGLDSLMAIEFKNRLDAATNLSFSPTMSFSYPTIKALSEHVAEKMGVSLSADAEPPPPAAPKPAPAPEKKAAPPAEKKPVASAQATNGAKPVREKAAAPVATEPPLSGDASTNTDVLDEGEIGAMSDEEAEAALLARLEAFE